MAANYILAHDLGTTGNKASLFDREGQACACVFSGYPTCYPRPNEVEQDPEDWWNAVCQSTRQLLSEAHISPREIACISFSGQMNACVPVDRQGKPLRSALIWADTRAEAEAQRLAERLGREGLYQITGHPAMPTYSVTKIMWFQEHQPELFAQTYKFLLPKDFIVARLTGKFVTDFSDASGTDLFDLKSKTWSEDILKAIDLDPALLPELHASIDVVGEVTQAAAEATGLVAGIPVVIGGGDGPCAGVGAGVVREGSAYTYIGSSSWIALATQQPIYDPNLRTTTYAHVVPGMYMPTGSMQTAGGAYQWLRDNFCLPEKEAARRLEISPYELMNKLAESSVPGAHGLLFLPYLLGERSPWWNPKARGVYFGLSMAHNRADIIRATLEGVTFNLRAILESFEEQGARIDSMRVIGGGARGQVWRQMMADIFGKPVQRPKLLVEATSLGAAIIGGVKVGIYKDFSVAEDLTPIIDVSTPHPELKPLYDRLYHLFMQTYKTLVPLYDDLADISKDLYYACN